MNVFCNNDINFLSRKKNKRNYYLLVILTPREDDITYVCVCGLSRSVYLVVGVWQVNDAVPLLSGQKNVKGKHENSHSYGYDYIYLRAFKSGTCNKIATNLLVIDCHSGIFRIFETRTLRYRTFHHLGRPAQPGESA